MRTRENRTGASLDHFHWDVKTFSRPKQKQKALDNSNLQTDRNTISDGEGVKDPHTLSNNDPGGKINTRYMYYVYNIPLYFQLMYSTFIKRMIKINNSIDNHD